MGDAGWPGRAGRSGVSSALTRAAPMRVALLLLMVSAAAAQPTIPADAPPLPRWRVDASAAVSGSGANDPGVLIGAARTGALLDRSSEIPGE